MRPAAAPRVGGDWSGVGWAVLTLGGLALVVAGLMSPWQAVDRGGPAVTLALRFPQPLLLAVLGSLSVAALLLLALLIPRRIRPKRKDDEEFPLYHEPPKLSVWALLVLLGLALVPVGILVSLFWLPGTLGQDAAPPPLVRGPSTSAPPPGSSVPPGPGRPAVSLPLYTGAIGVLALLFALGSLALLLWIFLGDRLARWRGGPFVEAPAVHPLAEAVEASLDDLRRESDARRVYPRIVSLRRLPHPLRTQTSVGNYVAPTFGAGLEPGEIRPFAPGDQVRHVNWRASLRLGKLYVTRYHQERNADVVLMLDTLSQVGRPPETSLDLCVRAAASLARAYLARKDRVGLIEYGGVIRWVRPGSGPAQLERFLDALVAAEPIFTYVRKELAMVPPRVLPPQALVIALSPLLDPRFVDAVGDLAARGFDLMVLAVSPVDITRASLGRSPVDELACRLWAVERRTRLAELRRRGLVILDWSPAQPLELVLSPLGRHRRRALLVG